MNDSPEPAAPGAGVAAARRVFFAALPAAESRRQLVRLLRGLELPAGRKVPACNLHLTLAFAGSVDEARLKCLLKSAARVPAWEVEMALERWGWFPRARVLWLGPARTPPVLDTLARELQTLLPTCGLEAESRSYLPHLTLARSVPGLPQGLPAPQVMWRSRGFALMESVRSAGGVRYRPIRRFDPP